MENKPALPAFPVHPDIVRGEPHSGMTLRDYFAAKAMHAAIEKTKYNFKVDGEKYTIDWDFIAESAYGAADAMLEEREK